MIEFGDGLWEKLAEYGISGKMWRVLRSIYENVESSVLVNDNHTRFFSINVGLRQGCLLSPILFAIYINGLAEEINCLDLGVKLVIRRNRSISNLLFADDIVLISDKQEKLQQLMDKTFIQQK